MSEPSHVMGNKEAVGFKHNPNPNIPAQRQTPSQPDIPSEVQTKSHPELQTLHQPIERSIVNQELSTTFVHMQGNFEDDSAPMSEPSHNMHDRAIGLADIDEIMKDVANSPRDSRVHSASDMPSEEEEEVRFR